MDTVVAELVSFFQALKSGSLFALILLAVVLVGLALIIAAVAYQRVVIKRETASKATQENFDTIAAELRKRALEVKKQDEGLRKRDLEKERDELKDSVKDAEPQRPQQKRQVLKGSQRALRGSVSHGRS
jgi:Flp pilus assembly protein TadB